MTILTEIDKLTDLPYGDADLIPISIDEFPEYKNVFKFLDVEPMSIFISYDLGDHNSGKIYYFDLSDEESQKKYLSLLKNDKTDLETLTDELNFVVLERLFHKDARSLELTLCENVLTPEQCHEDFMEDYDFNKGSVSSFYEINKLKSCFENYLVEIEEDCEDHLTFSFINGNGYSFTFEFDSGKDIYKQFHQFAQECDYDELFSEIYEMEKGFEEEPDRYNCEDLARGYINSIKNIDSEFQKTNLAVLNTQAIFNSRN